MSEVYVYAEHNYAAVGGFIGVCQVKAELDPSRLTTLYKGYRYYKDLLKQGLLTYADQMIQIEDINAIGQDALYEKALEGLLLTLRDTDFTGVRNRQCPYSAFYKLKINSTVASPGLKLTQYIVRSRRIGWIKSVAHKLYPHYDWLNNYGLHTYAHAKQVMLYGADLTTHTEYFLRNLAKFWLEGLKEYDLDLMLGYDYRNEPVWWRRIFKDIGFLDCLSVEELNELNHSVGSAPLTSTQQIINIDIERYLKELNQVHIYQKDYLALLNKCSGSDLERHLTTDKVACVEMQIHIIVENDVESDKFYGIRVWFTALSIILTQYYLWAVPYIKDFDVFKLVTEAQLRFLVTQPTKEQIENYIDNRKQLIQEIEVYERQKAKQSKSP